MKTCATMRGGCFVDIPQTAAMWDIFRQNPVYIELSPIRFVSETA